MCKIYAETMGHFFPVQLMEKKQNQIGKIFLEATLQDGILLDYLWKIGLESDKIS